MSIAAPIVASTTSSVDPPVLASATNALLADATPSARMDIPTAVASSVVAVTAALPTTAPLLTTDAQRLLDDFFQDETVAAHLETARHAYLDANRAVKEERSRLARFEAVCHRAAPKLELPKSLRIPWTRNALLSDPSDVPGLLQDDRASLALIEAECTKRAFDVLCQAKRKVIHHLEAHLLVNAHVDKHTSMFSEYVRKYAVKIESRLRPAAAPSANQSGSGLRCVFPVSAAIARFAETLRQDLNAIVRRLTNEEMRQDSESAASAALASQAQEQVLAGAHSGVTIKALAEQVVRNRLRPISAAVADLQDTRHAKAIIAASHSHPVAASASASIKSGKRHLDSQSLGRNIKRNREDHRKNPSSEFELDPVFIASGSLPHAVSGRKRPAPAPSASDGDASDNSSPSPYRSVNRQGGNPHARSLLPRQQSSSPEDPPGHRDGGRSRHGHRTFTPLERLFLANGLRFIPTPPSSQYSRFVAEYLEDDDRGWPRFARTLTSRVLRELTPSTSNSTSESSSESAPKLPKFRLSGNHTALADRLDAQHRETDGATLTVLDEFQRLSKSLLSRSVQHASMLNIIRRQRVNHTPPDCRFLRELMSDASIVCKPADKNLGLVLMDSQWYETELSRMLSDRVTYARFKSTRIMNKVVKPYTIIDLTKDLKKKLLELACRHEDAVVAWNSQLAPQVLSFLKHKQPVSSSVVPGIYLLPKVHKAKLSGRPIVPCTKWITTPASIVCDHLLQEVIRKANIPWLVKDTKSLIRDLEGTVLPHHDGVFVTADIASLYTNIDTPKGIDAVRRFLVEQQVDSNLAALILDLLQFVLENAHLQHKDNIYHQIDGTAMGTSLAPSYANIFVYMNERPLVEELSRSLYLYRRFLDDVLAYLDRSKAEEFMTRMNQLHPKLKFEFVSHPSEASFLDLLVHKGHRFQETGVLDLRVHQKSMNLYLYIPYNSHHTEAAKRSFIQTELMRYIRNSSSVEDYTRLKHTFFDRLRDRGYPSRFLAPLFNEIFYADRRFFLYPSKELPSHPELFSKPPLSACLLRRLARLGVFSLNHPPAALQQPPVFIVPYTPLSAVVPTRQLLMKFWPLLNTTGVTIPAPIIAYQSYPSVLTMLVFRKAKQHEKDRLARFASTKSTQPILPFRRIPSQSPVAQEQRPNESD